MILDWDCPFVVWSIFFLKPHMVEPVPVYEHDVLNACEPEPLGSRVGPTVW